MSHKIAVVGDKDSILPFKILGFNVFPCHEAQTARKMIDELSEEEVGIIYVTEAIASQIPDDSSLRCGNFTSHHSHSEP